MAGGIDPGTGALINQLANPPNPLEKFGQTVNALTAAKNFQAQQASADAYRQSVDPVTGEVDLGKYKALMSQGPGAFNFGPLVQQGGQAVGAVGQGTTADINSKLTQLNAVGQFMYPLLQKAADPKSGGVSAAEAQASLDQAHAMGLINDQQYQRVSGQIAQIPAGGNANSIVLGANMGNTTALQLLGGSPTYLGTGGGHVLVNPSPLAAPPAGPSYVPSTLSPGETIGTTTVPIGNNQSANVPNWVIAAGPGAIEQWLTATVPGYKPGSYQPPPGGAQPGGGGTTAPGRYPQPPAAPPAPGAQPAPTPATGPAYKQPAPPPPREAGGPGITPQSGYTETVTVPSQKAATAVVTAANDTPNVEGLINDMRSQVNQPGWAPGLGAQAGSTYRQILTKLGFNATPRGTTPADAQAAADEFSKDANLIASRQLATIGNPSDARQGLAEAITPGMAQSKEGVLGISATLLGNQHAIQRTSAAWADAKQQGWSDGRYNEWQQQWNKTDPTTGGKFDPRVFWLADTAGNADDQYRRMASKIPKQQQAQFLKNVQYAKDQGWIRQNDDGSFAVTTP